MLVKIVRLSAKRISNLLWIKEIEPANYESRLWIAGWV